LLYFMLSYLSPHLLALQTSGGFIKVSRRHEGGQLDLHSHTVYKTTVKLTINAHGVYYRTLASSPLRLLMSFDPVFPVYVNFTLRVNFQR